MSESNSPRHIYKIFPASAAPPSPIPETLPLSPLDASDGFIHLSTASQTTTTARLFFSNETTLFIAKIPLDRVDGDDVRWVEGSPGCAHLYNGPKLGSKEITEVKRFDRGEADWEDVLAKDEWFEA